MPLKRYAIIDIIEEPQVVVDIITVNDDPSSIHHETFVPSDAFHTILSSEAEVGWVFNGEILEEPRA